MSELDPLSKDLRALFAEERAAYADDPAAQARVYRRLEAAIVLGAAGAATTAAALAKTGLLASLSAHAAKHAKLSIALSLATGIAVGETHARLSPSAELTLTTEDGVRPAASPVVSAQAPTTSTPSAAASQTPEPAGVSVSSLPNSKIVPNAAPSATAPATASSEAPSPSLLLAEQGLIDAARSALSRGRGGDALQATDDHARQFPRGRLAEERETLAIQALLLLGRRGDAVARAERFHKSYPQSLYGGAVDALLRARPTGREDAQP